MKENQKGNVVYTVFRVEYLNHCLHFVEFSDILLPFFSLLYAKNVRCLMNYNKLWKLLIDKKLKKKDLREMTGLSTNVIAKMGKGGDVSTQVLRKICEVLDCRIEDIVDLDD